ncbi:MAG: CvpA family protein [Gammaproteobacteria bacterium]
MTIDYLLICIIALSAIMGVFRGLIREALALVAWVVAVWSAWQFGDDAAYLLPDLIGNPVLRLWAARLLMLIAALFVVGVISRLLAALLDQTGLSGANRLMGGAFGVARGAVLGAVVVSLLQVAGFDEDGWWNESKLIPYAAPITDRLGEYAEKGMDMLQTPPVALDSL